jgi:hypothetical protein
MTGHVVVVAHYQEVVARGRAVKLRLSPGHGWLHDVERRRTHAQPVAVDRSYHNEIR